MVVVKKLVKGSFMRVTMPTLGLIMLASCLCSCANRSDQPSKVDLKNDTVILTHPTLGRAITVVTKGDQRFIYDGVCRDCKSYERIRVNISMVDPLGDGIEICWTEPSGWYVRSLYSLWISNSFKNTNYRYEEARNHDGSYSTEEYSGQLCGGIILPEKRIMPEGSLLVD